MLISLCGMSWPAWPRPTVGVSTEGLPDSARYGKALLALLTYLSATAKDDHILILLMKMQLFELRDFGDVLGT